MIWFRKRRVSNSDEEGSGAETPSAPTRTLPKRAAYVYFIGVYVNPFSQYFFPLIEGEHRLL